MTTENTAVPNKTSVISKIAIGKYNLPNILNGIGIRFVNGCNKVAYSFSRAALALNAGQLNYLHNARVMENCKNAIAKIIHPRYKKITTQLLDIKSWCIQQHQPYTVVPTQQTIDIKRPQLIDPPSDVTHTGHGIAHLPEAYLAELHQTTIIAGSNLILTNANQIILNDEIYADQDRRYSFKSQYVVHADKNTITVKYIKQMPQPIAKGIHFCHDFSHNYYHWILECLPRLYVVDQFADINNLPLLVDDGLTQQQLDALKLMNTANHPLHFLHKGHSYQVNQLFVPNMSTVIHDNYNSPVAYDKDVLISPTAIHYMREKILQKLGCANQKGFRKIFISRKQSEHRRLLNLPEIENLLMSRGFEIVFPEALTFANQVKLFAQAELVVGQTGAGFVNLMWCPENCKALFMINHNVQTSYYLFSVLTDILNIDLKFIPGTDIIEPENKGLQNDFVISIDTLNKTLDTI